MEVESSGVCPLLNEYRTITVEFIQLPTGEWLKGLAKCDYASHHDCDIKCPLYEKASPPK